MDASEVRPGLSKTADTLTCESSVLSFLPIGLHLQKGISYIMFLSYFSFQLDHK